MRRKLHFPVFAEVALRVPIPNDLRPLTFHEKNITGYYFVTAQSISASGVGFWQKSQSGVKSKASDRRSINSSLCSNRSHNQRPEVLSPGSVSRLRCRQRER